MTLRPVARTVAGSRPFGAVVEMLERLVPGRPDVLSVLTFHRVTEPGPSVAPGLHSATPAGFAKLLDSLVQRHTIVSIEDLLERMGGGPSLPRRSLLLTVDDAYVDFADHAWPALRARNLPVVLFVPTGYPDRPDRSFWWDRLNRAVQTSPRTSIDGPGGYLPLGSGADRARAYRRIRDEVKRMPHDRLLSTVDRLLERLEGEEAAPVVLGWDALRRLATEGVSLAPHTRTHPLLTRLDPTLVAAEIVGSREDLAREIGSQVPVFAYPAGASSRSVAAAVAGAALPIAFTTRRGVNDLRSADWLGLRRINVGIRTPSALIHAQTLR